MMKRFMTLAVVLGAMLAVVGGSPAFAQEEAGQYAEQYGGGEVVATGVIGEVMDSTVASYALVDEATGTQYFLTSESVDLRSYALSGERVDIYGTLLPRPDVFPLPDPVLDVQRVEPADGSMPGPRPNEETATLTFELGVEGEPPAGTTFFGNVQTGEGGPGLFVPLTDSDGDGLYDGTTTVDRFGPGPRPVPPGVEPLEFGVRMVQGTGMQGQVPGEPVDVIEDFGVVPMEDRTFSASVSFGGEEPEEGSATGVIEELGAGEDEFCGLSTHAIVDEASGLRYDLTSDVVDLAAYTGERVSVYGEPLASPAVVGAERCPDLDVTRIERLDPTGGNTTPPGGTAPPVDDGADPADPTGKGGIRTLPATGGAALLLAGSGMLLLTAGLLVCRVIR